MIPKLIHYVWVGNKPLDELSLKCIESWKSYMPEYQIIQWDDLSIFKDIKYINKAFKNKKWSNISNYIRLHALNEFGGIYFDTDFEVIREFDFTDKHSAFMGFESEKLNVNNAVMGAVKNHPFIVKCLAQIVEEFDGTESAHLSSPGLTTNLLKKAGLITNKEQNIDDVHLFPRSYFHPYNWNSKFTYSCLKNDTYGIHHWANTWTNDEIQMKLENYKNGSISFKELLNANKSFFKWHLKNIKAVK